MLVCVRPGWKTLKTGFLASRLNLAVEWAVKPEQFHHYKSGASYSKLMMLCRLRSAETVTASLPLALGLTNKDERWINFNFNSVSRMCKSDDDIS